MSLTIRRRAIYTGLASHFPEDEVLPLLSLWETKYADKPPFALNEFLAEVVKRSERKLERARLYRELVSALTGPSSNLLPDPAPRLQAWREGDGVMSKEMPVPDTLAWQTFEVLSRELFSLLDAEMVPRLRRFAAGNLSNMPVETELRMRLGSWLEHGGSVGLTVLNLEQLRMLLNLLYIGLCEYLGPVTADQVLTRAVQKAERHNLKLAPQKLL